MASQKGKTALTILLSTSDSSHALWEIKDEALSLSSKTGTKITVIKKDSVLTFREMQRTPHCDDLPMGTRAENNPSFVHYQQPQWNQKSTNG